MDKHLYKPVIAELREMDRKGHPCAGIFASAMEQRLKPQGLAALIRRSLASTPQPS